MIPRNITKRVLKPGFVGWRGDLIDEKIKAK